MDTKKIDPKHSAEVAAGTTLALGTPAVSRVELGARKARLKRIDAKTENIKSQIGSKGTPVQERPSMNGQYMGRSAAQKTEKKIRLKRLQGDLNALNTKRKLVEKPKIFPKQTKLWATGLAVGVPLAWHGARNHNSVEKRVTQEDVDAGTLGAVGGFTAYQGGSLALKPIEKPAERKIKNNPTLKGKLEAHRKATLPKNAPAGHPAWREYNRKYPKDLPGAKLKRINAHLVSGRRGGLLTLGAMGAAGAGAVALEREHNKQKVSKMGYELNNSAPKSDKRKFMGAGMATAGVSGVGGALVGNQAGDHMYSRAFDSSKPDSNISGAAHKVGGSLKRLGGEVKLGAKNVGSDLKYAASTKSGKVGLGLVAAGTAGAIANKEYHKKKGTIVKKNLGTSAFGIEH